MTDILTRRDFLAYGGATVAGLTLGQLGRRQLAHADELAARWRTPAHERLAVSVCRECPAACGIRVRLIDDVPVKLDGNPLCPISRGRLCPKGQAALETYFDPDRLIGPARRTAENRWEPVAWEAAIALVATHLRALAGRPGSVRAAAVEERGPIADRWTRFWTAAGADLTWTPAPTAARLRATLETLTGVRADPLFDLENATHVLSFGAPLVEDWVSPVWAQRAYGRFRRGEAHRRGRLVQVEGRRSLTARKADDWIVVPPERQAPLAYGLVAVLCREGRVNRPFLDSSGGNFADFARAVIERFTPDEVAAATGVPVVTILRLARELVATSQPLVVAGCDAEPDLIDAVFALNAAIGAFDRRGGIAARVADQLYADPASSGVRQAGAAAPRVVALRDPSALRSLATRAEILAAAGQADLVVSFSPYLDEAAAVADLLMPVHTPLESWHAVVPAAAMTIPGQTLAAAAPAVEPRLQTRDLLEVLAAVAAATGGPVAAACDWKASADVTTAALHRRAQDRRGAPYATPFETAWLQQLERGGWWTSAVASAEEFPAAVLGAGGWTDPFFEMGHIRRSISERGGLTFPRPLLSARPAGTQDAALPLRLMAFTPAVVSLTGSANQAVLFELLGQPDGLPWRVWAELNADTARTLGIASGQPVRITSAHGEMEAVAVLVDGMPEDRVAVANVPAVVEGGRWAKRITAGVASLWPAGVAAGGSVAVRVSRL